MKSIFRTGGTMSTGLRRQICHWCQIRYGKLFDKSIVNHNSSNFTKLSILENYEFNLCPENQIYPGYFTEKIPEAYLAGCIPITSPLIECQFNRDSVIDILSYGIDSFCDDYLTNHKFREYYEQPLLHEKPRLEFLISRIKEIVLSRL